MKNKQSKLIMLLVSVAFILFFQFIPAPAGLSTTSMQVIGIFIGIMLMWNLLAPIGQASSAWQFWPFIRL